MDYSMPDSSVLRYLPKLLKFMSIGSVMLSNHLLMFHPPSPSAFNLSQHQNLFQMWGLFFFFLEVAEFLPH